MTGMGRLGAHFPLHARQEYVDRHFVPGCVLYLSCSFTTPPKPKYVVVVSTEPEVLFFVINSSVRQYIRRRPHLYACQVRLQPSDHSFLSHDSFIDCAKLRRASDIPDMVAQLIADTDRIKGTLSEKAKREVLDAVRSAKTISKASKAAIEAALGNGK